jgi:hypothetical protein
MKSDAVDEGFLLTRKKPGETHILPWFLGWIRPAVDYPLHNLIKTSPGLSALAIISKYHKQ